MWLHSSSFKPYFLNNCLLISSIERSHFISDSHVKSCIGISLKVLRDASCPPFISPCKNLKNLVFMYLLKFLELALSKFKSAPTTNYVSVHTVPGDAIIVLTLSSFNSVPTLFARVVKTFHASIESKPWLILSLSKNPTLPLFA